MKIMQKGHLSGIAFLEGTITLKKNEKRPIREHMSCPKIHTIPLNATLI